MPDTGLTARIRENIVLYGALAANLGIGVAKFVAAGITGSSSMLTEGVHSVVDSGNQILLLYGQKRAKRGPDAVHPFGYGRELYFWAFVVAILIFALGSGISIYEGWLHIKAPEPLRDPTVNYIVLAIAFALEGASWTIAVREFSRAKGIAAGGGQSMIPGPAGLYRPVRGFGRAGGSCHRGAGRLAVPCDRRCADRRGRVDPDRPRAGAVAILLAREAKGLLIGERADPEVVETIREIVAARPGSRTSTMSARSTPRPTASLPRSAPISSTACPWAWRRR